VLEVGDAAPDFELRDQHGAPVRLSSGRGRKPVLLVFFPAAFSSVCSSELNDLRDGYSSLTGLGAEVLAISCDPMFSLRAYSDAEGIDYPLLSDFWPHGAVAQAYGVFDDTLGRAKRSTYLVDKDGKVAWTAHHAAPDPRSLHDYEAALENFA
jgi:peroxiredoxin